MAKIEKKKSAAARGPQLNGVLSGLLEAFVDQILVAIRDARLDELGDSRAGGAGLTASAKAARNGRGGKNHETRASERAPDWRRESQRPSGRPAPAQASFSFRDSMPPPDDGTLVNALEILNDVLSPPPREEPARPRRRSRKGDDSILADTPAPVAADPPAATGGAGATGMTSRGFVVRRRRAVLEHEGAGSFAEASDSSRDVVDGKRSNGSIPDADGSEPRGLAGAAGARETILREFVPRELNGQRDERAWRKDDVPNNVGTTVRDVPVALGALESALTHPNPRVRYYLDLSTGDVLRFMDDARDRQMLTRLSASPNYLRVVPIGSVEQYAWLRQFILTLENPALQAELNEAIDGAGAFRRFKDVLSRYEAERQMWMDFRHARVRTYMQWWLSTHGVRAVARGERRDDAAFADPPPVSDGGGRDEEPASNVLPLFDHVRFAE